MFVATYLLLALATLVAKVASIDEFLIMDIDPPKNVPESKIFDMLSGLEIKHKFRVTGTTRLLVVIKLDPQGYYKLDQITLPGNVSSTPAEDMADTMKKMGVIWPRSSLTGVNVTLFESHAKLTDATEEQHNAIMIEYGEHMTDILKSHPYQYYRAAGETPHKHFFFVSSDRAETGKLGEEGVDIWGGPGEFSVKPQYVIKL